MAGVLTEPPGDGFGTGYGAGYGDGFGAGYGSGDGSGDDGPCIGEVDTGDGAEGVYVLTPWPVVRIGCQTHGLNHWRTHWREIAEEHRAEISEAEVGHLNALAQKHLEAQ